MQRFVKFISSIILLCLLFGYLMSCAEESEKLKFNSGTARELRIGVIGGAGQIAFGDDISGDGRLSLGDGYEYSTGDLKPVWRRLSEMLGVEIVEVEAEDDLKNCDLVIGTVEELDVLARKDLLLDLSAYYSNIPNLKNALYENETIFSYLGKSEYGEAGVYIVPTFCEEVRPSVSAFIREDIVRLLLDTDFEGSKSSAGTVYAEHYMPSEGRVYVDILSESGEVEILCKDYTDTGNIMELFRDYYLDSLTGYNAVRALRAYIDSEYNGYYGSCRSDLFLGKNAAYDADELCALLICIKANSKLLSEDGELCAAVADKESAVRMFSALYGVRGPGADTYTYIDSNGELADCRFNENTYEVLGRINDWVRTGILTLKDNALSEESGDDSSEDGVVYALSFGTQPAQSSMTEILPPIAKWYDGSNMDGKTDMGSYFRFCEGAVPTENVGIGISKKGTIGSQASRNMALRLLELAFTKQGREILLCQENKENIITEAEKLGYYNPEEYAKDYYGAGVCFFSPDFPLLFGAEGEISISDAVSLGIIRCPSKPRSSGENWYMTPPSLLPYSDDEYKSLLDISELAIYPKEAVDGFTLLADEIIEKGLFGAGFISGSETLDHINEAWKSEDYLKLLTDAYRRLIIYYYEYQKGVEY